MPRLRKMLQRLKIGPYAMAALAIIGLALLLRLILVTSGWPETDSDEGTMGLEAMHIAFRNAHPIFLYGQSYMGVIEAYLGALLFRLFGTSLFSLRLGMLIIFTLFLVCLYLLTSLIYTRRVALISLFFLSLGARNILIPEIRAVGGAEETICFGTLLLLLATWLALTSGVEMVPARRRLRLLAYAGWGLAAGLGLWSHFLVAPFILMSGLILLFFCWREWRGWAPLLIVLGLLVGALPLISYNLTALPGQNSLQVALQIHSGNGTGGSLSYPRQLSATLLYSLPEATGINLYCNLQEMPLFGPATSRTLPCVLLDGGWSVGYLLLLGFSIALALLALLKLCRRYQLRAAQAWSSEESQATIIHFARLMLLCSGVLTLLLFVDSPLAWEKPWSTRYLIGLLILTPAIIWPIWHGLHTAITPLSDARPGRLKVALRSVLLLSIGVTFLGCFLANFSDVAASSANNRSDAVLAHDLLQMGIKHIYSGYWVCDRLTFSTREQIICGVVLTDLKVGLNRYHRYYVTVASDPASSYVFPLGSDFAQAAAQNTALNRHYRHFNLDGYVVYQPLSTQVGAPPTSEIMTRERWGG
jgi:hypothetical protein